jgi:hypothetical protein
MAKARTKSQTDNKFVTRDELQHLFDWTTTFMNLTSAAIARQNSCIVGLSSVVTLLIALMRESREFDVDHIVEAIRSGSVGPDAAEFALDLLGCGDVPPSVQ